MNAPRMTSGEWCVVTSPETRAMDVSSGGAAAQDVAGLGRGGNDYLQRGSPSSFRSRAVISKYSFRGKATLRMWKSFLLSPTQPKQ